MDWLIHNIIIITMCLADDGFMTGIRDRYYDNGT